MESDTDEASFNLMLGNSSNKNISPKNGGDFFLVDLFPSNEHTSRKTRVTFKKSNKVGWGFLVGGWTNPFEKILVKMGSSSPNKGENKKYLKPPPSQRFWFLKTLWDEDQSDSLQWAQTSWIRA